MGSLYYVLFWLSLRVGEITAPSSNSYDAGAHLSEGDVTLDNREQPSSVQVTFKASKTDPSEKEWQFSWEKHRTDCVQWQLYLHTWEFVVPHGALSLPSRKAPHCPGSCL